jgi:hypothetical protein
MRHKRSEISEQKRFIKRLVFQCAFQDQQRCETVNILSREAIASSVSETFDYVLFGLADYERGEVLTDSRGNGSLQQ